MHFNWKLVNEIAVLFIGFPSGNPLAVRSNPNNTTYTISYATGNCLKLVDVDYRKFSVLSAGPLSLRGNIERKAHE